MLFKTTQPSLAIKVVTASVLALAGIFVAGGAFDRYLPLAGLGVGLIVLVCYLLTPIAYDFSGGCLTVMLRVGRLRYGPVVSATRITGRWPFTIRLFGNGGIFGGTGIYWNKPYGVFRAYVTSAKTQDAVLVRTQRYKVVLSPENPQALLDALALPPV